MKLADINTQESLQFDHYGGARLPYTCIAAKGMEQTFVNADGIELKVIDASGGYGSASLGAAHPKMIEAFTEGISNYGYVTDELSSLPRTMMLNELFGIGGLWTDHFPTGEYLVSGRNSGTEGLELALRLVLESRFDLRKLKVKPSHKEKNIVIAFEGAWHGWSSGMTSLLSRRHYRIGLPSYAFKGEDHAFEVAYLPFGNLEAFTKFLEDNKDRVLATFIEPIQGDAGIIIPPKDYLRSVAGLCKSHDTLLVADEVLTFGKTGDFFAMRDQHGAIPTDITVIGKHLGMGVLSTSMVISREHLNVRSCGAVSTSDLRPLTCSIIRHGIKYIVDNDLLDQSFVLGRKLREMINKEIVAKFPELYHEIRGVGYINGIELSPHGADNLYDLRMKIIDSGAYVEFMAGCSRRISRTRYINPTMRIAPPLIAKEEDLNRIVEAIHNGSKKLIQQN